MSNPNLNVLPRQITFRVWAKNVRKMHYPRTDTAMWPSELSRYPVSGTVPEFHLDMQGYLWGSSFHGPSYSLPSETHFPLSSTGLRTGGTIGRELYEGDIISFTIKGAPHGRERDECKAAHIWWNQDDACWAFGRWTQTVSTLQSFNQESRSYTWWYTMMDDIDRSSITLLGNIFENPELIPLLGYSPQL